MSKQHQGILMAVLVFCCLVLASCKDTRRFGTEYDAVSHFRKHRQQFDTMAQACKQGGVSDATVSDALGKPGPDAADRGTQECFRLAKQLSVVQINAVPQIGKIDEQYLQFALPGTSFDPYGLVFVPEGHDKALATVKSEIGAPPRVYRTMRQVADRWFYFEYQ